MSAPVTGAHRALVSDLRYGATSLVNFDWLTAEQAAQLVADSEARAVAQQTEALALMVVRSKAVSEELDCLRASSNADAELFHQLRMKLTAACGDPYKLHDEAIDAIVAERDHLRAESEHFRAFQIGDTSVADVIALRSECERLNRTLEAYRKRARKLFTAEEAGQRIADYEDNMRKDDSELTLLRADNDTLRATRSTPRYE